MASAVQEFLGKLSSGHRACCKWQGQVCPENLNSLPAISDSEIKVISLTGVLDHASSHTALFCVVHSRPVVGRIAHSNPFGKNVRNLQRLFKNRANALLSLPRLPILTDAWVEENVDADVRRHLMELLDSDSIGLEESSLQYPRVNSIPMRTIRLIALAGWDLTVLDYRIKDKNKQAASLPRDPDNPPTKSPRIEIEVIRDENGEKGAVLRCRYCTAIVPLWSYEDKTLTHPATQSLPSSPASLRPKVRR